MKREHDTYDSMTLTHKPKLKKFMTLSYLRTDTENLTVMSLSCHCHTYCHKVSYCEVEAK